ncbi:MAG: TSUP family transporter [Thermoguttaceae bacterium]
MPDHLLPYVLGILAAILVGLSKTGVPGVSIPAILLMTEAYAGNAKFSVGAILPVLMVGDLFAVGYYRRHTQWDRLVGLLPYVAVGMVPGVYVLWNVDDQQFKLVLGLLVVALMAVEGARQRFGWTEMPHQWWFIATMGIAAGFGTVVGNAAGPIMSIYLISHGMFKTEFMGTWAWFFMIVNMSKLPLIGWMGMINADTLQFGLLLVPFVVLGALVGKRLFLLIPQKVFDPLILALALVTALRMVSAGIWG